MGQARHGSATTPHAIRAAILRSQASIAEPSRTYRVTAKTVSKGRSRATVEDRKTVHRVPWSSGPSLDEDAVIVAFRRPASLPLVDWLDALQPTIPHLTRSSLDRCLQRNGISRLPDVGDKPGKRTFKRYPTGLFQIDIADPRTGLLPVLFTAC